MASYSSIDFNDEGWSPAYKIYQSSSGKTNYSYYNNVSNYNYVGTASWFQRTWWTGEGHNNRDPRYWARIYHNTTGEDLVCKSIEFLTCAGHSHGHSYMASGGVLSACKGQGCTFRAGYYVSNSSDYVWSTNSYVVPDVVDTGHGNVYGTAKGTPSVTSAINYFGGCRHGYYCGDANLSKYVDYTDAAHGQAPQTAKLSFGEADELPTIANGEYMFVVVETYDWQDAATSTLLVMLGDDPQWGFDIEVKEHPYIWRMTDMGDGTREWQKTHYAYKWSGTEWIKMTSANSGY